MDAKVSVGNSKVRVEEDLMISQGLERELQLGHVVVFIANEMM